MHAPATPPPFPARPSAPAPLPQPEIPFRGASLASLRLLAGFALLADETAPGREPLLAAAGAEHERPCVALLRVLAALQASDSLRGTLDGVLAAGLGRRARPYRGLCAASLAALWRQRRDLLEGPDLAALLWWVARSNQPALRPLEREIAACSSSARLVSAPLDPTR